MYLTFYRNQKPFKDNIKIDETEVQSEPEQETEVWDSSSSDHDSLDLFFASVCQSTKRLPKKYQNKTKRLVLDALLKVEAQFEAEAENKTYENNC